MSKAVFSYLLFLLYFLAFAAAAYVIWLAWPYYALSIVKRPHSPLHAYWKPGGLWGHSLGILGSSMILLLLLYSLRKRELFGFRWGRTRRWLDIHIFFGIMGPIFITLHTSLKFNGFISIGYYAMLAVMFSGILGRYIYMQIPRSIDGKTLTLKQIDSKDRLIAHILIENYHVSAEFLQLLQKLSGEHIARKRKGLSVIFALLGNDLLRQYRFRKVRKYIITGKHHIPRPALQEMQHLAKQKAMLMRRKALLGTMQQIFHYWHVIHKPFAYVMLVLMFLHVVIVVALGYRWIF